MKFLKILIVAIIALLFSNSAIAGISPPIHQPIATYSIVAYDPETEEIGVAVQSKFFAVGAVVPFAEAGVGAIATQSFANTTYGPRGLAKLKEGMSPQEVLEYLTSTDDEAARRQVGIINANGEAASFTGEECNAWAGHLTGENYAVQGNILAGEDVVKEMARAFEETSGSLSHRMIASMEAGQAAGGDIRGKQSAAIYILKPGAGYGGFNDVYCDLRVDDHETPITELRRLHGIWSKTSLLLEAWRYSQEEGKEAEMLRAASALRDVADDDTQILYYLTYFFVKGEKLDDAEAVALKLLELEPEAINSLRADNSFAPLLARDAFQD